MRIALVALVAVIAGCGDNAHLCGPGKTYDDPTGTCVPVGTCGIGTTRDPVTGNCVTVCTAGTKLNPVTGACEIDPSDCQDGTVLVNGQCVDPTGGLTVDFDEGSSEPNGFGVVEASPAPAGVITLKPTGSAFVIHGQIKPFQDTDGDGQLDADADTYQFSVTEPTLLEITADGVGGIDGGFVAIANVSAGDPLASWRRFGMNVANDTSKRQLYLPSAGTYLLTIADTRTLFDYSTGGPIGAAPGPGDYYVTIKQLAIPAPTAGTSPVAGSANGDVAFYTFAMGTGLNDITLAMPAPQTLGSFVVQQNSTFRAVGATDVLVGGFQTGDEAIVAVDPEWNYATSPAAYTLTVQTSDAMPLSTIGGTATETEQNVTGPLTMNQYYLDVGAAGQIDGIDVSWNHPVTGELVDGTLHVIGPFTNLGGSETWSAYAGLLRFAAPGRYYFLVWDTSGTPGTTQLTATSRIDTITPAAITEGTSTGTVALDASYHANMFTYAAGTDPWQTFDSTGTNTGGQTIEWFDPAAVFGRLDVLVTSAGNVPPPQPQIFQHAFGAGGGAIGRILLDDPTTNYLVKVNATSATSSPTFTLLFDKRTITDLGTIAANTSASSPGHTIDGTTTAGYFLFHTPNGNKPAITTSPTMPLLLDTEFQRVNNDESALGPVIDNPLGDDTESFTQAGNNWTAFIVTAAAPPATAQMYGVSVAVAPM